MQVRSHVIRAFLAFILLSDLTLAADQTFGSGNHVCTGTSDCAQSTLDILNSSDFSLQCADDNSCRGSTIVVQPKCTLADIGIVCDGADYACENATLEVYSSDLLNNNESLGGLQCGSGGLRVCANMDLILVDSGLALLCDSSTCANLKVYLLGESTLELKSGSSFDINNPATIYLCDESSIVAYEQINGYVIDDCYPASTPTVQEFSTTSAEEMEIIGIIYCNVSLCAGRILRVPSGNSFGVFVVESGGFQGTKLIVESGSILGQNIDCDSHNYSCMDAEIEVFGSELSANGWLIDCAPNTPWVQDICRNLKVTLMDSTVTIICGKSDCNNMAVHLYGASTITMYADSHKHACAEEDCNVYVYSPDANYNLGKIADINVINVPFSTTTELPTTTTAPTSTTETPTTTTAPTSTMDALFSNSTRIVDFWTTETSTTGFMTSVMTENTAAIKSSANGSDTDLSLLHFIFIGISLVFVIGVGFLLKQRLGGGEEEESEQRTNSDAIISFDSPVLTCVPCTWVT